MNKQWWERLRDWLAEFLHWERQAVDESTITLASNLMAVFILLGSLALPALPATLTGVSVYRELLHLWSHQLALTAAVIAGVALEALGMAASYAALRTYRDWLVAPKDRAREFLVSLLSVVCYVFSVTGVIVFLDELPRTITVQGGVSPFIVILFYASRGLIMLSEDRYAEAIQTQRLKTHVERELAEAELTDKLERIQMKRELDKLRREFELGMKQEQARKKLEDREGWSRSYGKPLPDVVAEMAGDEPEITGGEVARRLGISSGYARQLLREVRNA